MSLNRPLYDSCAYNKWVKENNNMLNYSMYPYKYENCRQCRVEKGIVGERAGSVVSGNLVDLESNLLGITKPLGRCDNNKHNYGDDKKYKYKHAKECKMFDYKPRNLDTLPKPRMESCNFKPE